MLLLGGTACVGEGVRDSTFHPVSPGVLRVVTNLPAPGFWNGASSESIGGGFEYAIVRELAERFDLRLEIVDVPFPQIVSGDLDSADLALAQIAVTPERSKVLSFSTSYLPADMGILARPGTDIGDLSAARAHRWVVEDATTEQAFITQLIRPTPVTVVVRDRAELLDALGSGRADAALLDLPTALATAHQSSGGLTVPAQFVTNQQLAIALPRGSPNVEPVNQVLRNLMSSGRLQQLEAEQLIPVLGVDPARIPIIAARTPF
jgi:polar amino acid transport system substrate-binding protein